jgi:hypothetical protein
LKQGRAAYIVQLESTATFVDNDADIDAVLTRHEAARVFGPTLLEIARNSSNDDDDVDEKENAHGLFVTLVAYDLYQQFIIFHYFHL